MKRSSIKTHAGRHTEGNTGRAHGRSVKALREEKTEPSVGMPGGPHHITHGYPKSAIGSREDSGEGQMSPLSPATKMQEYARQRLTADPSNRSDFGVGGLLNWGRSPQDNVDPMPSGGMSE